MIVLLILYIVFQYKMTAKQHVTEEFDIEAEDLPFDSTKKALLFVLFGGIGIAAGAELMVRGAITSAEIMHIPDAVIGLTVIAIGTSLPELSTAIIAAMKKQGDIILGNVVGSNVFNIMMILGVMSMIKPVSLDSLAPQILQFDVWVMLGSSMLFCLLVLTSGKFTRTIGGLFLSAYIAYIGYMYVLNAV
jgi:cation:H+ antiporter